MFLRELFEGTSTVGIIFGRFNPPHKGHKAAWELASQNDHWFVSTNQSTVGPKDPLPFEAKVEAMKAIWPEVADHIIPEQSWLTLASRVYEKYGDIQLRCYTDEDWVTKTIIQYNGKEGTHGYYNFGDIQQESTPRLSSATALRDAVTNGDRAAFAEAAGVPADTPVAGHPFFDLVAHYLLPYANAPKKAPAKKKAPKAAPEAAVESASATGKNLTEMAMDSVNHPRYGKIFWVNEKGLHMILRNEPNGSTKIFAIGTSEQIAKKWAMVKAQVKQSEDINEDKTSDICEDGSCNVFEMAMDTLVIPKYGKISWLNEGGAHMIARREPNGSLQIFMLGSHEKIAKKWAELKNRYGQKQIGEDEEVEEAAYQGNLGMMELFKFFSTAGKTQPDLVAKVKELISQHKDREVWQIIQDFTDTKLVGKEFE